MLKLQKRNKQQNKGFTLVEVIVSLLILSIITVSLLTAFSRSSKINQRTALAQGAEVLLNNLMEYTQAGGAEMDNPLDVYFADVKPTMATATKVEAPDGHTRKYTYTGVKQGFLAYTVEVTKDIDPDKYKTGDLNNYEQINLGDTSECSMMFDVCSKAYEFDEDALGSFRALHMNQLQLLNDEIAAMPEEGRPDPYPDPEIEYNTDGSIKKFYFYDVANKKSFSKVYKEDKDLIAREVVINVVNNKDKNGNIVADKLVVEVLFRYTLDSSVVIQDLDGDGNTNKDRVREYALYTSIPFYYAEKDGSHLDNIYLLYSSSPMKMVVDNTDIRLTGEALGHFKTNLFVVHQSEAAEVLGLDVAAVQDPFARMGSTTVRVKCDSKPYGMNVYCSSGVEAADMAWHADNYNGVTFNSKKLIATKSDKRVISYEIKVYDPRTNALMGASEVTYLINK